VDKTLEEEDTESQSKLTWEGDTWQGFVFGRGRGGQPRTLGGPSPTTPTWPAKQATAGPLTASRRAARHRGGGGGQDLGGGGRPNLNQNYCKMSNKFQTKTCVLNLSLG